MIIQDWFKLGMKREISLLISPGEKQLDLGPGKAPISGANTLDYPDWIGGTQIPYPMGSIDTIWAHHFLEHLHGDAVIKTIRECERVLKTGGTMNIVTPYYSAQCQAQDLDHKSVYCEETWRNLFKNPYYTKGREEPWQLKVNACFILGIVERNLALFTQLIRS